MKIRHKFFLMFGITAVISSFFLLQSVLPIIKMVRQANTMQQLCGFLIDAGSLIHETQLERAFSLVFANSVDAAAREELAVQRRETDAQIALLKDHLPRWRGRNNEFDEGITVIEKVINGWGDIRKEIDASTDPGRPAFGHYSQINESLAGAVSRISVGLVSAENFSYMAAYVNFIYAKENAGRERAVLYQIFIRNEFEDWHIKRFLSAIKAEEIFTGLFLSYATAEQQRYYEDKRRHPSFDEVEKIRADALQGIGGKHFEIEPGAWLKAITTKINVLKEVEDYLVVDMMRRSDRIRRQAGSYLALLLFVNGVLFAGIFIAIYLNIKGIVSSLGLVVNAAEQVRRGEFKVQIGASATDEIGILINAFNQMTQELRQTTVSKSYVDNIVANMMSSLAVLTLEGKIITVNKTTCDLLVYQGKDLEGEDFKRLFAAGEIPLEGSWIDALKGGIQNEEAVYMTKEGKEVPVLLSSSLLIDNDGRPQGIICMAQDITKRKEIEQALRIKEEYSRVILETAKDAFIAIGPDDIIVGWNPHAEVVFGWPGEEAMGRSLSETIIPEHYRKAHREGMKRFVKTGERRILNTTVEVTALHRDGREFPIELTIWAIQIDGKYQFNAFVRDITQRKRAEAEHLRLARSEER